MATDQKIEVKTSNLTNIMVSVEKGTYRIPQFQREYVWEKSKVIELLDSIYQEYPIGSFFLWNAGKEYSTLFRHSVGLNIPPVKEGDYVTFILDGQQRITSLYVVLNGLIVNKNGSEIDYSRVCFDLKEEKFTDRSPDENRYIPLASIWGPKAVSLMKKIDESYSPAFEKCFEVLKTYPISIVEIKDKDLPAVCKIFQRINQSGKRLDRFDLISAMTFTKDFDLREKFKNDLLSRLQEMQFGKISPACVTQLLALIKFGLCTERHEYNLTSADINESWKIAVDSILLAADILRKGMGVINYSFLPYDAILTLLSYYLAKSQNRSLPPQHNDWISKWFWRASFSQYYGSGGPTKMGRDRELLDQLILGDLPDFSPPMKLTVNTLAKARMTWTGSAIRNAFLCLLALQRPKHWLNGSQLYIAT